jgi:hypothetical protein
MKLDLVILNTQRQGDVLKDEGNQYLRKEKLGTEIGATLKSVALMTLSVSCKCRVEE